MAIPLGLMAEHVHCRVSASMQCTMVGQTLQGMLRNGLHQPHGEQQAPILVHSRSAAWCPCWMQPADAFLLVMATAFADNQICALVPQGQLLLAPQGHEPSAQLARAAAGVAAGEAGEHMGGVGDGETMSKRGEVGSVSWLKNRPHIAATEGWTCFRLDGECAQSHSSLLR
jgi:hypothetical protein